jgi:hypothetical protein
LTVAHLVKEVDPVFKLFFFSQLVVIGSFASALVNVPGLAFLSFALANEELPLLFLAIELVH